ncbi:MAG: STAS domain-containing protein [Pontiellaceae bacterium]|nr:STAS domain-containing protein [Pontiellaceae bacterium]
MDTQTLKLEGNLAIVAAAGLHEQLRAALESGRSLTLEFGDIDSIDLTFLQLLRAGEQSFLRQGLFLSLASSIPDALLCIAEEAGTPELLSNLTLKETLS